MMNVEKRDGRLQAMDENKIIRRLQTLKQDVEAFYRLRKPGFTLEIDVGRLAKATMEQVYSGITTSEIDEQAAFIAASTTDHPDYALFGGQLLASNLEANNRATMGFANYAKKAYEFVNEKTGKNFPLITERLFKCAQKYGHIIDRSMHLNRNWLYDYFAMNTLIKGQYLLSAYKTVQIKGKKIRSMVPFETPQHSLMRVSLEIANFDLKEAFCQYEIQSQKYATFATPTLFSAGTVKPSMISCFLQYVEDSIAGIYSAIRDAALISKGSGGLGFSIHDVRGKDAYIAGTNGISNGILPMLRVFQDTALYVDQGGGKRKGSFACYLEPWHPDIIDFLNAKQPKSDTSKSLPDLFYALWIPDLFVERIRAEFAQDPLDPDYKPVLWSLIDPSVGRSLPDLVGTDFSSAYEKLEQEHRYTRQIPIRELVGILIESLFLSGGPYLLFKDHCNRKSNQQNLGTIRSSNLCSEIVEFSSKEETACCNLASIGLPSFFVSNPVPSFDFLKLYDVVRAITRALNRVIDANHYPIESARRSNMRHRPIGIGIQGLADLFALMRLPPDSEGARLLNLRIAETMYFAALEESHALAVSDGPYESIDENGGAPIRHGTFHWELCNRYDESGAKCVPDPELGWDWEALRKKVVRDGVRNSLLIAHMPTASTSCIMGFQESFEPFYSNVYVRKTKSGEFLQINPHMVRNLIEAGIWSPALLEKIKANGGSLQGLKDIPAELQALHQTTGDLSLKTLTLLARDRGYYVDQSMSLNVHFKDDDPNRTESFVKYLCGAHKLGLKTAAYYTRTITNTRHLQEMQCPMRKPGDTASCAACEG
jgi:ribonucleoside-diphosphate reductase alpha chain